jgi:hypothetical protein
MLARKRSLLNREQILINVLKASASVISMCSLHVILLSKITPRYLTRLTKGIFRPFSVRWASGEQNLLEKCRKLKVKVRVRVKDWQFTANQFVLATSSFFRLNTCFRSPYITSSLTRGWVCGLQLLLDLASTVILGSDSRGSRDHILLPPILDSPYL